MAKLQNFNKAILIFGLLVFGFSFNSYAQDSSRNIQIEREIQEIKLRLSKLESLIDGPSNTKTPLVAGEGWKSISNWRMLTTGMSPQDVRKILGEPNKLDGGTLAYWHYPNRGIVTFYEGKVDSWREPRQ